MKPPIVAAQKIAIAHGIQPDRCEILQDGHTIVVRLTDSLVARIVTEPNGPRQGTSWFTRETSIAAHLSKYQAPVIPLFDDIPPVAHTEDGYTMNFWQYVSVVEAPASPSEMAITLHRCHEILKTFPEHLPSLAILHESSAILEENAVQLAFDPSCIRLLRDKLEKSIDQLARMPHQALHGDAHTGNLLTTSQGVLWTDWEDAFSGPIEWDIASLIWNAKLFDGDTFSVDQILSAYQSGGSAIDQDALDQCLIARAAVMSAWYPILYPNPSPERIRKLQHRMDWLRSCG